MWLNDLNNYVRETFEIKKNLSVKTEESRGGHVFIRIEGFGVLNLGRFKSTAEIAGQH